MSQKNEERKAPGIFPGRHGIFPDARLTEYPKIPPNAYSCFSGPKKQVGVRGVPAVTILSATFVFFLPCPGILPEAACDRGREVPLAAFLCVCCVSTTTATTTGVRCCANPCCNGTSGLETCCSARAGIAAVAMSEHL